MINRLTDFYILAAMILLYSSVYFQPLQLEKIMALGVETHTETAEEHEREANTNIQNGFSPARPSSNVSDSVENTQNINLSISRLIAQGAPILGNRSAPITIVEFGDFQCQFCGRFAKQTEPQLNTTYFQKGKANLVFKHFVTHGSDSFNAALASQCANDQGKFWNFYDILYNNQGEENSGWVSVENLKNFAQKIPGLDLQKFNSCLDDQKHKSFVENDTNFAFASGFQGTPTFVITKRDGSDREVLLGAYPFPSFQAIIDKKISEG